MTVRWQKNYVTKLPGRVAASGDGLRDWAWLQVVPSCAIPWRRSARRLTLLGLFEQADARV